MGDDLSEMWPNRRAKFHAKAAADKSVTLTVHNEWMKEWKINGKFSITPSTTYNNWQVSWLLCVPDHSVFCSHHFDFVRVVVEFARVGSEQIVHDTRICHEVGPEADRQRLDPHRRPGRICLLGLLDQVASQRQHGRRLITVRYTGHATVTIDWSWVISNRLVDTQSERGPAELSFKNMKRRRLGVENTIVGRHHSLWGVAWSGLRVQPRLSRSPRGQCSARTVFVTLSRLAALHTPPPR